MKVKNAEWIHVIVATRADCERLTAPTQPTECTQPRCFLKNKREKERKKDFATFGLTTGDSSVSLFAKLNSSWAFAEHGDRKMASIYSPENTRETKMKKYQRRRRRCLFCRSVVCFHRSVFLWLVLLLMAYVECDWQPVQNSALCVWTSPGHTHQNDQYTEERWDACRCWDSTTVHCRFVYIQQVCVCVWVKV